MTRLPARARDLLDGPATARLATLAADGAPDVEPAWVGREGDRVLVAVARDPGAAVPGTGARVAVEVAATGGPSGAVVVRGEVVEVRADPPRELLDAMAARHEDAPRSRSRRPARVLLVVEPLEVRPRRGGAPPADPRLEANKAVVLDMLDALARGDRVRARELFAPDATWQCPPSMPWPATYEGRDAIFDQYFAVDEELFETGVSEYDLEVLNLVAEGDQVAVEMRHRGVGLDGQPYETDHGLVYVVRDGRIAATREYIDSLYLSRVLLG
jgi:uncharacterized protein